MEVAAAAEEVEELAEHVHPEHFRLQVEEFEPSPEAQMGSETFSMDLDLPEGHSEEEEEEEEEVEEEEEEEGEQWHPEVICRHFVLSNTNGRCCFN